MGGLLDAIVSDPDDRRALDRLSFYRTALLSIPGHITLQSCSVRDITNKGAGIRLHGIVAMPLNFQMSFDEFRTSQSCRLIWRDGDFAGFAFL
jgi:hypothetical protein